MLDSSIITIYLGETISLLSSNKVNIVRTREKKEKCFSTYLGGTIMYSTGG